MKTYSYKGQIITASCKEEAIAQIVEAGIIDKIKEKLGKAKKSLVIKVLNKIRKNKKAKEKILELCDIAAKKIPEKKKIFLMFKKNFDKQDIPATASSEALASVKVLSAKERLLTSEELNRVSHYEGWVSDPFLDMCLKVIGVPSGVLTLLILIFKVALEAGWVA